MFADAQEAAASDVARVIEQMAQLTHKLENASQRFRHIDNAKMVMSIAVEQLTGLGERLASIHARLATKAPNLLTIRRELRDRIYDHLGIAHKSEDHSFTLVGYAGPWIGREDAIIYYGLTLTCKQLHDEVADMFWTHNAFHYIPPRDRKRQMSDKHMHLIKRWEVRNEINLTPAQSPLQPFLEINCWKSEIDCYGLVWQVVDNKLVLKKWPPHPKLPVHIFGPVAEKAIPIFQTLQNATRDGRVMDWDILQEAYERIGQLSCQY